MQYPVNSFQTPYVAGMPQQFSDVVPQRMPQLSQLLQYPTQPAPTFSYCCNFLEQLQGIFEMETEDGRDSIHVLMPVVENEGVRNQGCLIVRRVCSDGDALSDQVIIEEDNRFILCSINQEVLAYMAKGKDMRSGITWTSTENAIDFFWQRSGQVTFKFISATNFSSSMSPRQPEVSGLMPPATVNSLPDSIPAHWFSQNIGFDGYSSCSSDSLTNWEEGGMTSQEIKYEQQLFDIIKSNCARRPNLLKKVVYWGLSKDREPGIPIKMSPEIKEKLAMGRIWVSCMLSKPTPSIGPPGKTTPEQDALDNLKGAYQEVEKGSDIYVQPDPRANQPGLQHRLRKMKELWIIEERDPNTNGWRLRAKEKAGRNWLDMQNSCQPLLVKLIPLAKILERLTDYIFHGDVEKQLDFLFLECNQKKLNTKLKKRNLRHNIQNLKAKLQKQECLNFAVRVVKVADAIAKEHGIHG